MIADVYTNLPGLIAVLTFLFVIPFNFLLERETGEISRVYNNMHGFLLEERGIRSRGKERDCHRDEKYASHKLKLKSI